MGISHYRMNQLRDYGSDARSLISASYRWVRSSLKSSFSNTLALLGWLQASPTFRFAVEMITLFAVMGTILSFCNERRVRDEDRAHQAWTLVAAQAHDVGNIGLKKALEFLHRYNQDQDQYEEMHALSAIKLSGAELHGVKLPGANLNHSNFEDAEMSKSNLAGARLGDAKLTGAKLYHADLSGAKLANADLRNAKLVGADLSNAVLERTKLSDANLRDAKLVGADLSNAVLERTKLSDADLRDADLSQSILYRVDLFRSVLTGEKFNGAILVGVTLMDSTVRDEWPETALFCRTTMPNWTLNNSDCDALLEACETNEEDRLKSVCEWLNAPEY